MQQIRLTPKNEEKLKRASVKLDRSVAELANLLLDMIEEINIEENISVKIDPPNPPGGKKPGPSAPIRSRNNWSLRF